MYHHNHKNFSSWKLSYNMNIFQGSALEFYGFFFLIDSSEFFKGFTHINCANFFGRKIKMDSLGKFSSWWNDPAPGTIHQSIMIHCEVLQLLSLCCFSRRFSVWHLSRWRWRGSLCLCHPNARSGFILRWNEIDCTRLFIFLIFFNFPSNCPI